MDVFAGIRDARHIIQILRQGITIGFVHGVSDHNCRACCGKINTTPCDMKVMSRILAMQHKITVA